VLQGPLDGLRVLDLSRMVAGGVAGMLLADFRADVVKVEQPRVGDPLRQWTTSGQPFWWSVYGRNKRYITLNLKTAEGRGLMRQLVPRFDVLIESFVPGTMEKLNLGPAVLHEWNPRMVIARISGWGRPDLREHGRDSGRSSRLPQASPLSTVRKTANRLCLRFPWPT
jgi:crotonobetainyl-CoA:carnitine CoA-transferase CaiB-like acyl-CoA transferase